MSAAPAENAAPKGGGKKKLLIVVLVAVLVLAAGGVGAVMLLKKKAAHAEGEDGDEAVAEQVEKLDPKAVPTFVPLDVFTVNLADTEAERYAQIGIVLEVGDAKFGDQLKAYMPAVRNNILMVLAHKTSKELLAREGKELLAWEIKRESLAAVGIDLDEDPPASAAHAGSATDDADADEEPKPRKKKRRKAGASPIRQVQFSNFIIQ